MPRPLNFRQIDAFRAVMQTGTTTAAAAMLHTTQPSVSRLLAQLQASSGLKLFDIQKGRLRPTHEARELFKTVERHFLGLERIEQNVATLRRSGTGELRLGCTPALGLSVMPAVVHAFAQQHPDVHVRLQTLSTPQLREGLLHGQFDLAFSTTPMRHPQLNATTLHRSHAVCVLHPDHPLAGRKALHVRDLQGQVLLALHTDDEIYLQLKGTMEQYGIAAASTVETTYSATICMLAAQGTGVGVVNPYVASVFAPQLRTLPLRPRCPVEVVLAFAPQSAPSTMAEHFVALLQAHFAALPGKAG